MSTDDGAGMRDMGKGLMAMLATLLLLAGPVQVRAEAQAPVDLEQYLKRDGYGRIKISPDGLYFAATVTLEDRVGLAILRRSDKKVVAGSMGVKDSVIHDFWWAKDDQVLISIAERVGSRDAPYPTGQLFALGIDGSRVKTLVGPKVETNMVTATYDRGPWEMAWLIDTLPGDERNVLISAWDMGRNPLTRVEKLN